RITNGRRGLLSAALNRFASFFNRVADSLAGFFDRLLDLVAHRPIVLLVVAAYQSKPHSPQRTGQNKSDTVAHSDSCKKSYGSKRYAKSMAEAGRLALDFDGWQPAIKKCLMQIRRRQRVKLPHFSQPRQLFTGALAVAQWLRGLKRTEPLVNKNDGQMRLRCQLM